VQTRGARQQGDEALRRQPVPEQALPGRGCHQPIRGTRRWDILIFRGFKASKDVSNHFEVQEGGTFSFFRGFEEQKDTSNLYEGQRGGPFSF